MPRKEPDTVCATLEKGQSYVYNIQTDLPLGLPQHHSMIRMGPHVSLNKQT